MVVKLDNEGNKEDMIKDEVTIKSAKENSYNNVLENQKTLRDITFEFDGNTGSLLLNLETLKNINIELGQIADKVENANLSDLTGLGLLFHDIDHKILLLSDLFYYTINDLEKNYEQTKVIKNNYFDIIVNPENS